jgi:hypothetical protein
VGNNFYDKILVRARNIGAKVIFPKYFFWAYIGGLKVKSDFSTNYDRELQSKKYSLHYKPLPMTSLSS